MPGRNVDEHVVADFGREWGTFDQSDVPDEELLLQFERYFAVFPWDNLPRNAVGFDAGCGSGRWARFVVPRVGLLHCVDASAEALEVAKNTLVAMTNCEFHHASIDELPLEDGAMDFGYCLGVLHHVPDTVSALKTCVSKLRPGAPFLVYLYYDLQDRPHWFRALFRVVSVARKRISRWPHWCKLAATSLIALVVYLPLARAAALAERLGRDVEDWPLSFYRDRSVYTLRTDALDRFGTRLEKRFSRDDVVTLLMNAGLTNIVVSSQTPYWCAVGLKGTLPAVRTNG
ncbi:MAG: class I SAM-dependent methyltransferase [Solirubrobacteraceae bacterium]